MKGIIKRAAVIFMAAVLFLTAGAQAFADTTVAIGGETGGGSATSGMVITGYRILDGGRGQISRGNTVSIEVTLKCTAIDAVDVDRVDAVKLVDSFNGSGGVSSEVLTQGNVPLEFALTFNNITYSGVGNTLKFNIGFKGEKINLPYESSEVVITQCKPYEEKPETEKPNAENPAPFIILSRGDMEPVAAKKDATVTINIKNVGTTTIKNPVATFSTSEGLMMTGSSASVQLSDIPAGSVQAVNVPIRGANEISSASQTISVDMKFLYDNGNATAQGTASDKVAIPVTTTGGAGADNPSPNIIITKFAYGGSSVEAGGKFELELEFTNTSLMNAVENIVMTVETGESFAIDSATNTYFYRRIPAGGSLTEKVAMQALPGAKTGAQAMEISFKYEFIDGTKRSSATMSEKISVPLFQKDRFEVSAQTLPTSATAGEELTLSLSYVNKGKSEVSNVEASVVGDVQTTAKVQNLGNFESGKSGAIGFVVTPTETGKLAFKLRVAYEDANQQLKEKVFDVNLDVAEPVMMPETDMPMEEDEQSGGGVIWWVLGAVLIVGAGVLIILKRRKKAAADEISDFQWDDGAAALNGGEQDAALSAQNDHGKDES